MKHIKIYINEKLHVTTKSHLYSCQPKTWDELHEIIIQRIKEDGNDCDLNDIDVSKITDMSRLFDVNYNKIFKDFIGDISRWDVSNVKCMKFMFTGCEKFNSNISRWDVSNVNHMRSMFFGCANFNSDLSRWNVSNVEYMPGMFYDCKKFNQNLNQWDVSNVRDMYNAFENCPTQPKWYKK